MKIYPRHEIFNNVVCATSKGSDQPASTRSLIRAFASRLNILWTAFVFLSFKGGCTGWSESIPHCWKSRFAAQMYNGPGPSQTEEHISKHMAKCKKKKKKNPKNIIGFILYSSLWLLGHIACFSCRLLSLWMLIRLIWVHLFAIQAI